MNPLYFDHKNWDDLKIYNLKTFLKKRQMVQTQCIVVCIR